MAVGSSVVTEPTVDHSAIEQFPCQRIFNTVILSMSVHRGGVLKSTGWSVRSVPYPPPIQA